jgi:glycosyltransferase involved in cell wall biosynthesis
MVIARSLVHALRDAGHDADIVVTPQNRFGRQASAYVATWLTDVGNSGGHPIDQVISLRYPSYAVRHPRHVCWLNHTMREYYDLWDRFSGGLSPQNRVKEGLRRRAIHAADRYLLTRNVTKLFVQSRTIQQRLQIWPELRSTVLYPPAPPRAYRCDDYNDYVFIVSRLTALKRVDLVIQALATPACAGIRAVIGGDGEERERLVGLTLQLGVSDRVTLAGPLTDSELVDHLAQCRCVCFPPFDEDYGFVTAEAFASGKAVITCRDSGGPAELVEHGVNGFVAEPTPASLGEVLARVMRDRALAETLGSGARASSSRLKWAEAVRVLTAE